MTAPADRAPVISFRPDRRLAPLALAGALVLAAAAVLVDDRAGRALLVIATLVLLVHAAVNLIYTPRLVAGASGLLIRTPATRVALRWDDIEKVDAEVRSRLGLTSTTLEVDAGEVLVVFSRWALGVEPEEAARLIAAVDPRGR